jgi:hypothetical protein
MKGYFTKKGKYKSGVKVVVVTEDDVTNKKEFNIEDKQAQMFVDAKRFMIPGFKVPRKDKKEDKE